MKPAEAPPPEPPARPDAGVGSRAGPPPSAPGPLGVPLAGAKVAARHVLSGWRLLVAVVNGFRGESLTARAGNLTFITTTSLIPMAAVILSLVHVMNEAGVEQLVLKFFDDILAPAGKSAMVEGFRKFVHGAPTRAVGSLSFFFLLGSSSVLLRHLDASLNEVWAVTRRRPFFASVLLYGGILIVGPILMGVGLAGSDGVRRVVLWLALPFSAQTLMVGAAISAGFVFTLLYKLAPHAPVPWNSALIGGFSAGFAWEVARHLYGSIAQVLFSANPIYGSVGIAPLFLMWIYVGWFIVLSGARLAYAVEHAEFHDAFQELHAHPRTNELIAGRIAVAVTRAHLEGRGGPNTRALAFELQLPEQRVRDTVHRLERAGLLIVAARGALHPASSPSVLTLADISLAVGGTAHAAASTKTSRHPEFAPIARFFTAADDATVEKLKGISWEELARSAAGEGGKA